MRVYHHVRHLASVIAYSSLYYYYSSYFSSILNSIHSNNTNKGINHVLCEIQSVTHILASSIV